MARGKKGKRGENIISVRTAALILVVIAAAGWILRGEAVKVDFAVKNLKPSLSHLFGTDWMGRDMLARSLSGLSASMGIGLLAATVSAGLAFCLGTMAAMLGRGVDAVILWLIDLVMGAPNMLLLVLISFSLGRGVAGVTVGIALTHWTSLARVIRAEALQLKDSPFVRISERLGAGRREIVVRHLAPHLLSQLLAGLVLMFPHAILHEAGVTFLGFGLPPEQPAIGGILSESMAYLAMGQWWLAFFPGILLVAAVLLFLRLGRGLSPVLDPAGIQLGRRG